MLMLLPLLIGIFWASAGYYTERRGNAYHIGIVDFDQTEVSQELIENLSRNPSLSLIRYDARDDATRGLSNKEVLQTYILLEGFEEKILEGNYNKLVEVVTMMKSPYSDWLDDQISVGVIREWIVSDGYKRLQERAPQYTRDMFKEAFDAYYSENELLRFSVISCLEDDSFKNYEPPFFIKGFLWTWIIYLFLVGFWVMRHLHAERTHHILRRLRLSGVSEVDYLGEYLLMFFSLALIGSIMSLAGLYTYYGVGILNFLKLSSVVFGLGFLLFVLAYGLSNLNYNANQLSFIYGSVVVFWCLLASDIIAFIPGGTSLQKLSPVFIFLNTYL